MTQKDKAKKKLIETFYEGKLIKTGDKLRGLCPFHGDDKNPNFFIYLKTNSWYCFAGCGGGDSIAYYMRKHKVDFKTAIKELIK